MHQAHYVSNDTCSTANFRTLLFPSESPTMNQVADHKKYYTQLFSLDKYF